MTNRFYIIDGNAGFRSILKGMLQDEWKDAVVEEFDPPSQGWPGEDVDWSSYDLLFIEQDLKGDSGLEWFVVLSGQAKLPPTIILSARPDPEVAVKAIKAGVENYLPKKTLDRQKLKEAVEEVLGQLQSTPASSSSHRKQTRETGSRVIHVAKSGGARHKWPNISGHEVLKKIGQGGMSLIYLARREADDKQVVIKTLTVGLAENAKSLLRSNQEFKLISRISHPGIVRLYEHGNLGDALYTTMEYFPKGDLKQRLRKRLTQQEALSYVRQIAEGLNAIHACGIVHRDLKPGNIMFREDGSLAIIDFGISKDIHAQLDLTSPGQVMGTPNYMAPEQGKSVAKPDPRADIYSLGVLLFEMLTGKKPYAAPTGAAILYKHQHDPIPQLPNQFFEMQILIEKMMAKSPQQRFQSAYDILHFLDSEFP
ncbi:MAG TPA: protein kinase [Gammaproteobacteria bacterium]